MHQVIKSVTRKPAWKLPEGYGDRISVRKDCRTKLTCCPVLGCPSQFSDRKQISTHLSTIDHRYLPNPLCVKFLNINYTAFFEYTHQVVVCLKVRNVFTRKTYKRHKASCPTCAHNHEVTNLAVELLPGKMVQGLRTYMLSGNLYQIIDHHKWIILPETPIKILLDKDPNPVDGIQGHVPVFMKNNHLGSYLLDEETSNSVLSNVYSELEQVVYDSSMAYFLHGILKLNTTSAQRLRIHLKNRCQQDGYHMFQPVRHDTALEYAAFFSRMTVILYRNGLSRPNGHFFSCTVTEPLFAIENEEMFRHDHVAIKSMLTEYKLKLNDNNQEVYEYPHGISEAPDVLDLDTLRLSIKTGSYNTLFSLQCIHKWWCLELLSKPEEHMPLHFQAFGALIQQNRTVHTKPAKAGKQGSGLLFGLRLVVWNELVMRQESDAYQYAWNLCFKGLGNSSHVQYFYSLLDDIYEVTNIEGGAVRVVLDTRLDRIHFDNAALKFDSLQGGISRWCESLVCDYRFLVMGMNVLIEGSDQLGNATAGYTFSEDNDALKTFMAGTGALHNREIQMFLQHFNNDTLTKAGKAALTAYVSKAENFLLSLMTLIRMSTLGACRATELRDLTFRNRHQVMRSICFNVDMAFLVINVTKNESSPKLKQYIPKSLSELLKGYLTLVRPFLGDVYSKLGRTYDPDFRYYLMHNYTSKFSEKKLRQAHQDLTAFHLGVSIGFVAWRHAMEFINIVLYRNKNPKLVRLLQHASRYFGHTERTVQDHYGHGIMRQNDTSLLLDGVNRDLATAFHCWLGYETLESITETAAYIPKKRDEFTVADVEITLDDIQKKLPDFSWKSPGQMNATRASLARKESYICILPTGGGKSMTFIIPILFEPDLHTVIVVPFVALKNDIVRALSKFGITANTKDVGVDTKFRVHVVTQNSNMLNTVTKWHNTGRLARVIIDEAHELVTNWRKPRITHILGLDCQKVFLSATLPEEKIITLKNNYNITRVIREPTLRSNIEYNVIHCYNKEHMVNVLQIQMAIFDSDMAKDGTPTNNSIRALIYLKDRNHLEEVSKCIPNTIKWASCFSETINREQLQKRFFDGEIQCLIATKSFSTGIDYPNVALVVHWDGLTSITDFEQCSGRAGRNGNKARSVVIVNSIEQIIQTTMDEDERLAVYYTMRKRDKCLRACRSMYFDGKIAMCRRSNAVLCSWCRPEVPLIRFGERSSRKKVYATISEEVRNYLNKSQTKGGVTDHKHFCINQMGWTRRANSENGSFSAQLSGLSSGYCKRCGFKETQNDFMIHHERAKVCPFGHCMQEALEIVHDMWSENRKDSGDKEKFRQATRRLNRHFNRRVNFSEAFMGMGELDGDLVIVALAVFYIDELCLKIE